MKHCSRCCKFKVLDEFQKNSKAKDGRRTRCRECIHNWYVAQVERQRANFILRTFGVTLEFIENEKIKQGFKCAICRRRKPLEIDHDHVTGKYRGMLCGNCNKAIGLFKDCSQFLAMAQIYLEERIASR